MAHSDDHRGVVHTRPRAARRARMVRRVLRPLLALVVAVAVAGCSSGSEPGPVTLPPLTAAPSSPPSGSPSPSPTSAPVRKPAEADEATGDGAVAFARLWYDEVNRSAETLNAEALRAISHRDCGSCSRLIRSLEKSAEAGETYRGGRVQLKELTPAPIKDRRAVVVVDYDVDAVTVLDRDSEVAYKGERLIGVTDRLVAKHNGEVWTVIDITRLDS